MKRFIQMNFCLSLVAFLVVTTALQANGQRRPKFVKYCSLFDSTYKGKNVSSRALMSYSTVNRVDGDDTFLYSADCNGADYFAIPEGSPKVWRKWHSFFHKLQAEKDLTLEIQFVGKPIVETSRLFGSLDGWARAQIEFSKILFIRDVTSSANVVLADYSAAKPNIERIEGMRTDLRNFLQSLYAPNNSRELIENSLPNDFLFLGMSGKRFNKNQYLKLNTVWVKSASSLKESRTSFRLRTKTDAEMTWRGTLQLVFTEGSAKIYNCDVTFVLLNGEWTIRQAAMVRGS